ncbi:MAG: glycerophosphodiester phosphodiesterase [Bacteroidales bacterium]
MKQIKYRNYILAFTTTMTAMLIFTNCIRSGKGPVPGENNCRVKIIAHRGAWKKNRHPQNSLASLRNAIELKVEGSEFDVRITADDSLVINHDSTYNGLVIEKTPYSQLVQFRLSNGEKLPALREYISEGIRENYSTKLVCELKSSGKKERNIYMAERSVEVAREINATEHISWISFDYNIIKRISELEPDAEVFYLKGDMPPASLKSAGIKGAGYNLSVFRKKPEWIDEAKKSGVLLNVWTVNNADEMEWFISRCFDYITTDEPELLIESIKNI